MSPPVGRTALDHLRLAHLRRSTGTLSLEVGDRRRRLHLIEGRLHLPPTNPLATRLAELPRPSAAARQAWLELLERIAESLDEGTVRFAELKPGSGELPARPGDALPTSTLIRAGYARRERASAGRLSATERLASTHPGAAPPDELGWSAEELWVLERLRAPATLAELERDCPFPAERLRPVLAGLLAVERIQAPTASEAATPGLEISELAARFAERVAGSLAERPLKVAPEEYRRRIAEMLARAGELGHDELLGVGPDASPEALQDAFEELARFVHPVNAERYGIGGRTEALRFLFERATEAYRTLTDPQLRVAYLATRERAAAAPEQDAEVRLVEARRAARRLYERAVYEEGVGEVHTALQLYEQAARADPRAEYWSALGRLQARNPAWTTRAIESLKSAVELDPQSGDLRYALGQLHERLGDLERARGQYQAAAAAKPPHAGAREALVRLGAAKGDGAFARLFRKS